MVPRVHLDVPTCKCEAIQTSRAVRRVHTVFKLVALRVMSLYSAYSSNISTWLAWAAASAPVKPLLVDFLTFYALVRGSTFPPSFYNPPFVSDCL